MAGRTMAYGRACYGWAQKRGKVASNPFQGLPVPAAIVARDRVLDDREIGEVWRAGGTLGFPFGPLVRLMLLTDLLTLPLSFASERLSGAKIWAAVSRSDVPVFAVNPIVMVSPWRRTPFHLVLSRL